MLLMAKQIDLPDCFENRVVREQVCVYKALTAPAKGLWLSWPKGQGKTLCAALEPIVEALHPAAPELELPDLAATPADALDTLGGWPLTDTERASLTEALRLPQTDAPRGLALLRRMEEDPPRQVNDLSALSGLLGQRLRISPSQLEKYYTCRYGYFLQYVLGLKPRRRAELSADQSGTLMHWVLQMALDPHPDADNPCAGLAPFLELDDDAMAEPCQPAGGRICKALSAGGYGPVHLSALAAQKKHDKPFVLPAGRTEAVLLPPGSL